MFFEIGVRFQDGESWRDAIAPCWLPKSQIKIDAKHKDLWLTPWILEHKEAELAEEYGYKCCEIVLTDSDEGWNPMEAREQCER